MATVGVLGDLFIDLIALGVKSLPVWGGDCPVDEVRVVASGMALNTALSIALMNTKVKLIGGLGDDTWGTFYRENLIRLIEEKKLTDLLDTSTIKTLSGPTAVTIVLSGADDRSFVSTYGATAKFSSEDLDWKELEQITHLHICGYFMLTNLLKDNAIVEICKKFKSLDPSKTISLDPGFDPVDQFTACMNDLVQNKLIDILLPNEIELVSIAEKNGWSDYRSEDLDLTPPLLESPRILHSISALSTKIPLIVATLGKEGAVAKKKGYEDLIIHKGFSVAKVVDTTGAGDAFTGGFLSEFLETKDITSALTYGCAAGSLAVTRIGTSGAPTRRDLDQYIKNFTTQLEK